MGRKAKKARDRAQAANERVLKLLRRSEDAQTRLALAERRASEAEDALFRIARASVVLGVTLTVRDDHERKAKRAIIEAQRVVVGRPDGSRGINVEFLREELGFIRDPNGFVESSLGRAIYDLMQSTLRKEIDHMKSQILQGAVAAAKGAK